MINNVGENTMDEVIDEVVTDERVDESLVGNTNDESIINNQLIDNIINNSVDVFVAESLVGDNHDEQLVNNIINNNIISNSVNEQLIENTHEESLIENTANDQIVENTRNEQLIDNTANDQIVENTRNEQLIDNTANDQIINSIISGYNGSIIREQILKLYGDSEVTELLINQILTSVDLSPFPVYKQFDICNCIKFTFAKDEYTLAKYIITQLSGSMRHSLSGTFEGDLSVLIFIGEWVPSERSYRYYINDNIINMFPEYTDTKYIYEYELHNCLMKYFERV